MPTWAIYLGGAVLLAGAGFLGGWQVREWKADSEELVAVKDGIQRGKELQQLADYKAGKYEEDRYEAQVAEQGRDTEIRTIYRTQNVVVPAQCEPPADALSVLEQGIAYANSQVAGEPGPEVSPNP